MITYNHEPYIAQALDSILMQETTFPFEIVIGEDCSSDSTRQIAAEYARCHPGQVRLLEREQNIGMMANFIDVIDKASGQYLALLEGDDYWTDALKLQKQFDFLESNPQVSLCFHDVFHLQEWDGLSLQRFKDKPPQPFTDLPTIIEGNFINTCTTMFRKASIPTFPCWFKDLNAGDWPLFMLLAMSGKIGYMEQPMATYRVTQRGAWTGMKACKRILAELDIYEHFNDYFSYKFDRLIRKRCALLNLMLANEYAHEQKFEAGKKSLHAALGQSPLLFVTNTQTVMRTFIRLYLSAVYGYLRGLVREGSGGV